MVDVAVVEVVDGLVVDGLVIGGGRFGRGLVGPSVANTPRISGDQPTLAGDGTVCFGGGGEGAGPTSGGGGVRPAYALASARTTATYSADRL